MKKRSHIELSIETFGMILDKEDRKALDLQDNKDDHCFGLQKAS